MPEEGRIDPLSVTVTPSMDGNGFKQGENYTFRHYKNSLYETLNSNGHPGSSALLHCYVSFRLPICWRQCRRHDARGQLRSLGARGKS